MPYRLTYNEITDHHLVADPKQALWRLSNRLWRTLADRRAMGQALVAGLLLACERQGCVVRTGLRAQRFVARDGRVSGVEFEHGATTESVTARHGVVIATGGFGDRDMIDLPSRAEPVDRQPRHEHRGWAATAWQPRSARCSIAWTRRSSWGRGRSTTSGPGTCDTRGRLHLAAQHGRQSHGQKRSVNEVQMNVGLGLDARDPLTGDRLDARVAHLQCAVRRATVMPCRRVPDLIQADSLRALRRTHRHRRRRAGAQRTSTSPVLLEVEKIRRNIWLELNNYLTPLEQIQILLPEYYTAIII